MSTFHLDRLVSEAGIRKADLARLTGCAPCTVARWDRSLPIPVYALTILAVLRDCDPALRARLVSEAKNEAK